MTEEDFVEIKNAINLLEQSKLQRVDGKDWTVYKMANIIRLDIKVK